MGTASVCGCSNTCNGTWYMHPSCVEKVLGLERAPIEDIKSELQIALFPRIASAAGSLGAVQCRSREETWKLPRREFLRQSHHDSDLTMTTSQT